MNTMQYECTTKAVPPLRSAQEEFDAVCEHLVKQGQRAYDEEMGACLYRAPNGLQCAVGCRIPDEVYHPDMEEKGVDNLLTYFKDVLPPEIKEYQYMFESLQHVHDTSTNWKDIDTLKGKLRYVAGVYDLKAPAVIQ